MDYFPIISQVKSFVQWVSADTEGAEETQLNFIKGCPIASQITSAVQAIQGNEQGARDTQMHCLRVVEGLVDGTPVLGHVKGAIHYACGDGDRGDQIMKAASRSTGVAAGGVVGFLVGGPVGSVAGGIAGASVMDGTITGVESAIHQEFRPYGYVDIGSKIADGEMKSGDWFDAAMMPVADGFSGYGAGKLYQKLNTGVRDYNRLKSSLPKDAGVSRSEMASVLQEKAKILKKTAHSVQDPNFRINANTVDIIMDNEHQVHTGYSSRLRQGAGIKSYAHGEKSTLQTSYPTVRSPNVCGLHPAFESVVETQAKPKILMAAQIKQGVVIAVEPCINCQRYVSEGVVGTSVIRRGLGRADGLRIPNPHQILKAAEIGAGAIVGVTLASKQASRRNFIKN